LVIGYKNQKTGSSAQDEFDLIKMKSIEQYSIKIACSFSEYQKADL